MSSAPPILVIGAGAWGTALALVLARNGTRVLLWDADRGLVASLQEQRRHPRYFPELELPANLTPISVLADARGAIDTVLIVVPFQHFRACTQAVWAQLPAVTRVACASKGIELESNALAHEIVADVLGPAAPFLMLSGPNFAREVAVGLPAAITVGASSKEFADAMTARLHGGSFRAYTSSDVVGVEVGGAVKNVIAIGAGIADGLELGANSRAAVVTRGLAEIARFGVAAGGRADTFMGLSGLGDLVLTCTDDQSRNRRFGIELARGVSVADATDRIGLVEGIATARAVVTRAAEMGVEMPISEHVLKTINGQCTPAEAVEALLARGPGVEDDGFVRPFTEK